MDRTTHILTSNGGATTHALPLPASANTVLVIDWINYTFISANGATPGTAAYAFIAVNRENATHSIFEMRKSIASTANISITDSINFEFGGTGMPIFLDAIVNGSGSANTLADHIRGTSAWTAPNEQVAITAGSGGAGAGQTISAVCLTVGYHYEGRFERRSENVG